MFFKKTKEKYKFDVIESFLEELYAGKIKCQSRFCSKFIGKTLYMGSINLRTVLFCSKECRKEQLDYSRMFVGEADLVFEVSGDR